MNTVEDIVDELTSKVALTNKLVTFCQRGDEIFVSSSTMPANELIMFVQDSLHVLHQAIMEQVEEHSDVTNT